MKIFYGTNQRFNGSVRYKQISASTRDTFAWARDVICPEFPDWYAARLHL